MPDVKKILVISHGHPSFSKGGGEIAAHNLHTAIKGTEKFESVFFARHDQLGVLHGGTAFAGNGKPDEVLFYSTMPDWFQFSQPDKPKVWRDFRELLDVCQPDLVHFHHYVHLGIELIREVKRFRPSLPVVLTLHEYFGICHNYGQMVKPKTQALCHSASPLACSGCFPDKTPQDFFLREQFIKSHFNLVDSFVAPSQFLAKRYVEWGLSSERISTIENLLEPAEAIQIDTSRTESRKVCFGFFGQINWFKGIDVIFDAVETLPASIRDQIIVEINGSGLELQKEDVQEELTDRVEASAGVIRLPGGYQRTEVTHLMATTDWVLVPSKWWENSPVVILEAKKNGVPVICSDIGGMAEKVEHGRTGRHFSAKRADSLAEQMIWAVEHRAQQPEYAKNIQDTYDRELALQHHLRLYQQLIESEMTYGIRNVA